MNRIVIALVIVGWCGILHFNIVKEFEKGDHKRDHKYTSRKRGPNGGWVYEYPHTVGKGLDKYLSLFQLARKYGVDPRLMMALVQQESAFKADAVSPSGAKGLTQLMPATAKELGVKNPIDPKQSIIGGSDYLRQRYVKLTEIPSQSEKLNFTLASYNQGSGTVFKALALARKAEGMPSSHKEWVKQGSKPGKWQTWKYTKQFMSKILPPRKAKEVVGYVRNVTGYFEIYKRSFPTSSISSSGFRM